ERAQAFLGAQRPRLVLAQRRRDEALGADQRLPALVVGRHERQVRARHLDVVAEHLVVADLERRDARALALRRLEAREPAPGVARRLAQLVHLSVAPGADEAGESRVRRGRGGEGWGGRGGALGGLVEGPGGGGGAEGPRAGGGRATPQRPAEVRS